MTQCFAQNSSSQVYVRGSGWHPCPVGSGCCFKDSECLSSSICHTKSTKRTDAKYSSYFTGGCTDPSFTNPACTSRCRTQYRPDIVYNYVTKLWACCGTDSAGNVRCDAPTDEMFDAPPPEELIVLSNGAAVQTNTSTFSRLSTTLITTSPATSVTSASLSFSITSVTISSTSSIISITSTLLSSETPGSVNVNGTEGGLSSSQKVGIGIGVSLGVVAAIVAIALFRVLALRNKSDVRSPRHWNGWHSIGFKKPPYEAAWEKCGSQVLEMGDTRPVQIAELDSTPSKLAADSSYPQIS